MTVKWLSVKFLSIMFLSVKWPIIMCLSAMWLSFKWLSFKWLKFLNQPVSADVVRIFLVQCIKLLLPLPARRGAVVLAGTYKIGHNEQARFAGRAKTLPGAT